MRAERIAASLTAKGLDMNSVGHSTKPREFNAAYLAGISNEAMLYTRIVYMGEATEANISKLYHNVLLPVSKDWKAVGVRPDPANRDAYNRWREKNAGLIRKLVDIVVAEAINPSIGNPNKGKWRAAELGITERRWYQEYADRYWRVNEIVDRWDRELRMQVNWNQREAS